VAHLVSEGIARDRIAVIGIDCRFPVRLTKMRSGG
jgi:hypothetical protein